MKKQKKQPKQPAIATETEVDGLDLLIQQLEGVSRQAAAAVSRTKGGDPGLVREAVNVATELRKLRSAKAKETAAFTDAALIDYFRKLSPERRAEWVRAIQSLDRKGSVLG